MRAVQIQHFGSLRVVDLPDPVSEEAIAVVRVKAASINPSDVKNMQGAMRQTTLPRVPGRDYSGVVESGPDAWVGEEVWGSGGDTGFTRDGTHAERIAVPVSSLRRKPTRLSFEEASAVGVNFIAAWCGIVEAAALVAGETIAIIGSSGGVGGAAAQIAKSFGARVIGVDRATPPAGNPILELADHLISGATDVTAAIREVASDGVDVVFDLVGGPMVRASLGALRVRGRLVEISASGGREASFDLLDFYHNELRIIGVDTLKRDLVASAAILERLSAGFETGQFRPAPIALRYGLDGADEAYRKVAEGTQGRVLLAP